MVSIAIAILDKKAQKSDNLCCRKSGREITIWEAIQKRSHVPIYKTYTKIEAKRLRATTFAICKVGKTITKWGEIEKSPMLLSEY